MSLEDFHKVEPPPLEGHPNEIPRERWADAVKALSEGRELMVSAQYEPPTLDLSGLTEIQIIGPERRTPTGRVVPGEVIGTFLGYPSSFRPIPHAEGEEPTVEITITSVDEQGG